MAAQIKPTSFQKCDIFINVPTRWSQCVFTFYILYLSIQYLYFRPRSIPCSQKATVIPQTLRLYIWTSFMGVRTYHNWLGLPWLQCEKNPLEMVLSTLPSAKCASGERPLQIPLS